MPTAKATRRIFAMLPVLGLAACSDHPTGSIEPGPGAARAVSSARDPLERNWIPGQYVVVFKYDETRNVPALARALASAPSDTILHVYQHAVKGFAARMAPAAAEALKRHPLVESVLPDEYGTADQAPWGLDRIDQRDLPLNGIYAPNRNGSGVNIYIVDSGIRRTHSEFGGRAHHGYSAINDGRGSDDCNGHGTHVAGTAAGATYGVAKQATLYAVRVMDCNGTPSISGAIAGFDWIAANRILPAVVNYSISNPQRSDIDQAVQRVIGAGVVFVTSAGNQNADACSYSPKTVAGVLVVGNSDQNDTRAFNSNWGACVDMFAPGTGIVSAFWQSDVETRILSGTSMSSPHTAGIAALYLQGDPSAPTWKVTDAVINSSTMGKIQDTRGTANRLLYAFPVYFSASMSGPTTITASGSYTWTAVTDGGNGSYTYQWSLQNHLHGFEQTLGTGPSQTVYLNKGDGDFTITLVASSAGQTHRASMFVRNAPTVCDPSTFGC